MRNPDKWQPPDPDESPQQGSRRAALIGLIVVLLLLAAGVLLSRIIGNESRFEDCTIAGRKQCGSSINP